MMKIVLPYSEELKKHVKHVFECTMEDGVLALKCICAKLNIEFTDEPQSEPVAGKIVEGLKSMAVHPEVKKWLAKNGPAIAKMLFSIILTRKLPAKLPRIR